MCHLAIPGAVHDRGVLRQRHEARQKCRERQWQPQRRCQEERHLSQRVRGALCKSQSATGNLTINIYIKVAALPFGPTLGYPMTLEAEIAKSRKHLRPGDFFVIS